MNGTSVQKRFASRGTGKTVPHRPMEMAAGPRPRPTIYTGGLLVGRGFTPAVNCAIIWPNVGDGFPVPKSEENL